MASMKTRIIVSLRDALYEVYDREACDAGIARLRRLGAPESLIQTVIANQASERLELPRAIGVVAEQATSRDSIDKIVSLLGKEGFSAEIILIAWNPKKVEKSNG